MDQGRDRGVTNSMGIRRMFNPTAAPHSKVYGEDLLEITTKQCMQCWRTDPSKRRRPALNYDLYCGTNIKHKTVDSGQWRC